MSRKQEDTLRQTNNNPYYDLSKLKTVLEIPEKFEKILLRQPKEIIKEKWKSICLIGSTGVGKSSTCNTICGNQLFETSDHTESFTYQTKGILTNWFGDDNQEEIIVIDTPGLGDSQGRDTKHIAEMVCVLQEIQFVHAFVICFNSQQPRLDENMKGMLRIFGQMFGENFYNNVIFLFTRWDFTSTGQKKRLKKKAKTMDEMVYDWQATLNKELLIKPQRNQFIFLDNDMNNLEEDEDMYTPESIQEFSNQLALLKKQTLKFDCFLCHDLKAVMKENDKLKIAIDQQRREMSERQSQFEADIKRKEEEFCKERDSYKHSLISKEREIEKQRAEHLQKEQEMLAKQQKLKEDFEKNQKKLENERRDLENARQTAQKLYEQTQQQLREEQNKREKQDQEQKEYQKKQYQEERQRTAEREKEQQDMIQKLEQGSKEQYETMIKQQKEIYEKEINLRVQENQKNISFYENRLFQLNTDSSNLLQKYNDLQQQSDQQNQKISTQSNELSIKNKEIYNLKNKCVYCWQLIPFGQCSSNPYNTKQHKFIGTYSMGFNFTY